MFHTEDIKELIVVAYTTKPRRKGGSKNSGQL